MAGARTSEAAAAERVPRLLHWAIAALVLYRVVYHLMYAGEVPFAAAPVSDGRLYELAALDIVEHPPWGTQPFWLQGAYAYALALPMAMAGLGGAYVMQIVMAALGLVALAAACRRMLGDRGGALASLLVLSVGAIAFYENKFLTASITIVAECLILHAYARAEASPRWWMWLGCGAAVGLAVLARPNFVLAIPTTAVALALAAPEGARRHAALAFVGGVVLALLPMVVRNQVVTGHATAFPVHGGGTSFYIGNNAASRGLWNTADGALSGDVSHEVEELSADGKGSVVERERALGREMYARAWDDIAADPGRWIRLELRKTWLTFGNDELAQDYDPWGERELLPWAWRHSLPFGLVLGLAVLGIREVRRGPHGGARLWLLLGLVATTVIANLVFFTSSQHRVPLWIPLVVLAVPGMRAILRMARGKRDRLDWVLVAIAVVLAAQAFVPRARTHRPSAVHYYNLALAWDRVGEPRRALDSLDFALDVRPDHPVIRLERATLRRELGYDEAARDDLAHLATLPDAPAWVKRRAAAEMQELGPPPH